MKNIDTATDLAIENVSISLRGKKDDYSKDYFDILCDGKPIKFILSPKLLNTERGIYCDYVMPTKDMQVPLDVVTDLANKHKEKLVASSSLYLDIVLDINNEEDNDLYESLVSLSDSLREHLSQIVDKGFHCVAEHFLKKVKKDYGSKFNFIFLKDHGTRDNIKYVRLKVMRNTKSYVKDGSVIDRLNLSYKSFRTIPIVRIDNVRVPSNINVNTQFNVHLCIESQIVEEYVQTESDFSILSKFLV